jgi:hypothetical protein
VLTVFRAAKKYGSNCLYQLRTLICLRSIVPLSTAVVHSIVHRSIVPLSAAVVHRIVHRSIFPLSNGNYNILGSTVFQNLRTYDPVCPVILQQCM